MRTTAPARSSSPSLQCSSRASRTQQVGRSYHLPKIAQQKRAFSATSNEKPASHLLAQKNKRGNKSWYGIDSTCHSNSTRQTCFKKSGSENWYNLQPLPSMVGAKENASYKTNKASAHYLLFMKPTIVARSEAKMDSGIFRDQPHSPTSDEPFSPLFSERTIERKFIEGLIRVDHAGEFGAARIYDGQLFVLRGGPVGAIIAEMAEQEEEHLRTFERLMREYRVRPTALLPFWNVAGWSLGFLSALLGQQAAMAATVAIEHVITDHYNSQLRRMNELGMTSAQYEEIRNIVRKFRDDEQEHHNTGLEHEAEKAPFYPILRGSVQVGCRIAIWVSTHI